MDTFPLPEKRLEAPDFWPDVVPGTLGGARRKISYRRICSLQEIPRMERVLRIFPSFGTGYGSLQRLKTKDLNLLPPGVWHFYLREIPVVHEDRIAPACLGVFFMNYQEPKLLFPSTRGISARQLDEDSEFQKWVEGAIGSLKWATVEDQYNSGVIQRIDE